MDDVQPVTATDAEFEAFVAGQLGVTCEWVNVTASRAPCAAPPAALVRVQACCGHTDVFILCGPHAATIVRDITAIRLFRTGAYVCQQCRHTCVAYLFDVGAWPTT